MQTPENAGAIKFTDLPLGDKVQQAIAAIGYETPSPIQAQAIPPLLEGRDLLGVAQTGTGKTAAFALPILTTLDSNAEGVQVLCLAPTRELAIQVAEAFKSYAKHIPDFHVIPIYGGADYRSQLRQLKRGAQVVVGTPGRVMDHIRRGTLKLDTLRTLILDEADEMLRMGFIDDVEWILKEIPSKHQTALFSATMPAPIRKITRNYLNDPAEVTIKVKTTTAPGIRQRFLQLTNKQKLDTLTRILDVEDFDGIIIFVRTRNATLEVSERLQARGYAVAALNGDIAQHQREKTVARLKKGQIDIIVATDVAARGLDVERISHVINYDIPYDTESYVHRIGRTGRAGRKGDAILFVNGREKRMLQDIEKTTRQEIERFRFPPIEELNERKTAQLFERIDNELGKDLSEYNALIDQYIEHNPVDPAMLAAALASMDAGSQPFYLKQRKQPDSSTESSRKSERHSREKTQDSRKLREDDEFRADFFYDTYRLEVGEEHGVKKGDIVGAIANEADIESKYMGHIAIYGTFSTIDLPEGMPKEIFQLLKKVRVRGQQLNISKAKKSHKKTVKSSNKKAVGANAQTRKQSREKSQRQQRANSKKNTGRQKVSKTTKGPAPGKKPRKRKPKKD